MKCKDLAKELDITAMHVGRIRSTLFPGEKGDLTEEQAQAVREFLNETDSQEARKEMEEAVKPVFRNAIVAYAVAGKRRVEARLLPSMERILVLMPLNVDGTRYLRKPIKVEEVEHNGKKHYRHASLAGRAWKSLTQ